MAEPRSNIYADIPSGAQIIRTGGREVGKLADFVWTFSPSMLGGLMTKTIYNWGVKYFKSDKGSWTITKTDEGAGAAAVLLFEPHPRRFFKPDISPFRLQSARQRTRAPVQLKNLDHQLRHLDHA